MDDKRKEFYDSTGIGLGQLVTLTDAAANMMYEQSKRMLGSMIKYKELMMMYTCAMKEIKTKLEVQIRTIAIDFWTSLEHQLKYKQEIDNQQDIVMQFKACTEVIAATDERMLNIREQIEQMQDTPTEEDIMLEKLSKFDININ
ncbi:MAG: hypothetical protein J6D11_04410 [Clostridia bacterium]|nr:hypothetical protein [Clostridia bacterium]